MTMLLLLRWPRGLLALAACAAVAWAAGVGLAAWDWWERRKRDE